MTEIEVRLADKNGTLQRVRGQWISGLIRDEGYTPDVVEAIFANHAEAPDDPENKEEMAKFQVCRKNCKDIVDAFIESCGVKV